MSDHRDWIGQSAAYALGALDEDERVAFEKHLAGCAECRDEVREYRETAARLAAGSPGVTPPPGLRARVLDQARAIRPIAAGTGASDAGRSGRGCSGRGSSAWLSSWRSPRLKMSQTRVDVHEV